MVFALWVRRKLQKVIKTIGFCNIFSPERCQDEAKMGSKMRPRWGPRWAPKWGPRWGPLGGQKWPFRSRGRPKSRNLSEQVNGKRAYLRQLCGQSAIEPKCFWELWKQAVAQRRCAQEFWRQAWRQKKYFETSDSQNNLSILRNGLARETWYSNKPHIQRRLVFIQTLYAEAIGIETRLLFGGVWSS